MSEATGLKECRIYVRHRQELLAGLGACGTPRVTFAASASINNVNETPDSVLMEEVRHGDLSSLAILFERHHRSLFNFFVHVNGRRDLSEDLVQDVFFRILKYKKSYRPDRSFTAWMYQIARNAQVDAVQKHRNEVSIGDFDFGSGANMDESLKQKQELALLRRAMAQLPLEKRELLVLSRFQNMKYEEIAAILGCEIGAVKVRVYRAVRSLSQIYLELAGERAS